MKYYDTPSIMQVIGCIYRNPQILDREDKYVFYDEDFAEEFHRIIFGTLYNLYQCGAKQFNINEIEQYLSSRPKKKAIYDINKGSQYLAKLYDIAQLASFDWHYKRIKKMTLLRMYTNAGMDLSWLYDVDNIFDAKKKQEQEQWLDNHSLQQLADTIDKKITDIRVKFVDNGDTNCSQAGDDIYELINRFKETPEVGYPLYGNLINTITRGARLKKFYLRSAATGVGKTRSMIADACYIGCSQIYSDITNTWQSTGQPQSVMYITTQQDEEEVKTMMLAFISAVNEQHILTGTYYPGEQERIQKAAQVLIDSHIFIKKLPDFSMQDIQNTIKYGILESNCRYIFFDYIHSSMKILSEIGSRSGVKGLREDNVLFLISVKLKDLCNQYGVFILSSTQLNADYKDANVFDQNLLRGAKSIADKIDYGSIMLSVSEQDRKALLPIVTKMGIQMPQIKMSVYKNRRGRYKDILLWCKARRGICRIDPMFATTYNYELVNIDNTAIEVFEQ